MVLQFLVLKMYHIGHTICYKNLLYKIPEKCFRGPWCYTTDPNKRFEYCDIPKCGSSGDDDCWVPGKGGYGGTQSSTNRGFTCMRWDTNRPHRPRFFPDDRNNNFCRNPGKIQIYFWRKNVCRTDFITRIKLRTALEIIIIYIFIDGDEEGPWCYTTDPGIRYDYCDIPKCSGARPTEDIESILGTVGPSRTTKAPTTEGNVGPVTSATCFNKGRGGYLGNVSKTRRGKTCQKWSRNSPHKPNFRPEDDNHNFCRNPGSDTKLHVFFYYSHNCSPEDNIFKNLFVVIFENISQNDLKLFFLENGPYPFAILYYSIRRQMVTTLVHGVIPPIEMYVTITATFQNVKKDRG